MTERACARCHEPLPPDRAVCPACGSLQRREAPDDDRPWEHRPEIPPPPTAPPPQRPATMAPPRTGGHRDRGGHSTRLGVIVLLVALAASGAAVAYAVTHTGESAEPAPLNRTRRTTVHTGTYTFTMDGQPTTQRDQGSPVYGPEALSTISSASHDSWDEMVAVVHVDPTPDTSRQFLSKLLAEFLERYDIDRLDRVSEDDLLGRPAVRYEGHDEPDRMIKVGRTQVLAYDVEVVATAIDDRTFAIVALAWDPDRPPPDDELLAILRSFEQP